MRRFEASGVSVRLGAVQALDGVDLALAQGQALMLVGPNGAGKSTLLKVLLGLVRPNRARFEVDGARIAIDNAWKRHIGYLPEAVAFSENLSGSQLLRFFASARGVARSRVAEVLGRVGLTDAAKRAIRGYSRGMRQRLGLGVAILSQPELLILDEPTSGLDQEGLTVLWSVIAEWRDHGRMVLTATHDLALMERRMDEICILRDGRVVARGTAAELRDGAGLPDRVWLDVAGASEEKIEGLCQAASMVANRRVERVGTRLLIELPSDRILELMEIQSGFPGVVRRIRVEEPTLDLVYDKLLGEAP